MNESVRHAVRDIYCEVLFELAEESKKVDSVMEDLSCVSGVLNSEPEFAAIMTSPTIKGPQKAEIVRRVFGGKVENLTLDFLSVLARRNRMGFLAGITGKYEKLIDVYYDRHLVEVTLAKEPDDDRIKKLKADLGDAINAEVKLEVIVEPEIVGGIIIKKDDKVIDNSVRMALQRAAEQIKSTCLRR